MNQYGQQAMDHWRKHRPQAFSQLENPEQYFEDLGQEAVDQLAQLKQEILLKSGEMGKTDDYLSNLQMHERARKQAEEVILNQLILLPPEDENS